MNNKCVYIGMMEPCGSKWLSRIFHAVQNHGMEWTEGWQGFSSILGLCSTITIYGLLPPTRTPAWHVEMATMEEDAVSAEHISVTDDLKSCFCSALTDAHWCSTTSVIGYLGSPPWFVSLLRIAKATMIMGDEANQHSCESVVTCIDRSAKISVENILASFRWYCHFSVAAHYIGCYRLSEI